jgi:hypothetical protein
MSAISPEETVIRVSSTNNEPVSLRLEAGQPVTVRVEVENNCNCRQGSAVRPGSYTDIDFGSRR